MKFLITVTLFTFSFLASIEAKKHHHHHNHHPKRHSIPTPHSNGKPMKASFTVYSSDQNENCAKRMACGMHGSQFTAAINQNYYGVAGGQGTGPGCGRCWLINNFTNPNGHRHMWNQHTNSVVPDSSVVIYVDNLCPPAPGGGGVCGQTKKKPFNQFGAAVHFDLCYDTGTQFAAVGNSGIGLFLGRAQLLEDCSQWLAKGGKVLDQPWNVPKTNYPYVDGKPLLSYK